MTLDKWQKFNKYEEEIIYNCSDYYYLNDSWVDFPIGVYWSFINNRNLLSNQNLVDGSIGEINTTDLTVQNFNRPPKYINTEQESLEKEERVRGSPLSNIVKRLNTIRDKNSNYSDADQIKLNKQNNPEEAKMIDSMKMMFMNFKPNV